MKQLKKCVICNVLHNNELTCSIKCRSILDSLVKTGIKNPNHSKALKEKHRNGYKIWNKGLKGIGGYKWTEKSKKGFIPWNKGKKGLMKHTDEWKKEARKRMEGKNHWNWQNGKTELIQRLRNSLKYKNWRKEEYEKDNYTCQICGLKKSGWLEAHHIEEFNKIIKKCQIETFEEALNCEELWNINNGITLCKGCHNLLHNKKLNKLLWV